jgi:hypothetical protein
LNERVGNEHGLNVIKCFFEWKFYSDMLSKTSIKAGNEAGSMWEGGI